MLVFSIHSHRVSLGFFPPNMGHEDSSHGHGDFKPAKHDMERGWMGYHWGCDPAASGGRRTAQRVWGPREVAATNRVWNKRRGPGFNKRCESLIWVEIFVRFFSGKGRGKREDWMGFHGAEAKVSSDVKDYSWVFEPDNWRKTENQLKWDILTSLNPMIRSFKNTWSIAEAYEDSAFARQRELVEADTRHVATCGMCN